MLMICRRNTMIYKLFMIPKIKRLKDNYDEIVKFEHDHHHEPTQNGNHGLNDPD